MARRRGGPFARRGNQLLAVEVILLERVDGTVRPCAAALRRGFQKRIAVGRQSAERRLGVGRQTRAGVGRASGSEDEQTTHDRHPSARTTHNGALFRFWSLVHLRSATPRGLQVFRQGRRRATMAGSVAWLSGSCHPASSSTQAASHCPQLAQQLRTPDLKIRLAFASCSEASPAPETAVPLGSACHAPC